MTQLTGMTKDEQILLNDLSGDHARRVLSGLCAADSAMRKLIVEEVQRVLGEVDVDEVAEVVLLDLEGICVENLWDRAGASSRGYSSPDEMAVEMFEEAIHPYEEEVENYSRLGMPVPRMHYLMGILKGIYRYEKNSKSEFKDWATDIPAETFGYLLDSWRKNAGKEHRKLMNVFVADQCPDWAG